MVKVELVKPELSSSVLDRSAGGERRHFSYGVISKTVP
jgi:hypothetical protein